MLTIRPSTSASQHVDPRGLFKGTYHLHLYAGWLQYVGAYVCVGQHGELRHTRQWLITPTS